MLGNLASATGWKRIKIKTCKLEMNIWNCFCQQMTQQSMYKIPKNPPKKPPTRTKKWVQQGHSIQDQHIKMKLIYIHIYILTITCEIETKYTIPL